MLCLAKPFDKRNAKNCARTATTKRDIPDITMASPIGSLNSVGVPEHLESWIRTFAILQQ